MERQDQQIVIMLVIVAALNRATSPQQHFFKGAARIVPVYEHNSRFSSHDESALSITRKSWGGHVSGDARSGDLRQIGCVNR
jgi:hypothetical protein